MKYKYYVYRIVLTNKKGSYSTLRMRGQKLAKKYIVPHAKKQNFDLAEKIIFVNVYDHEGLKNVWIYDTIK